MGSFNTLLLATLAAVATALVGYYLTSNKEKKILNKEEFKKFPLIKKTVLSKNSAIYRFGLPNQKDVLGLPIGQHISIKAEINGKEFVRSYTPTSLDEDSKGHFDLLIKVYPEGNITKFIDNLNIGECIDVRGPKGFFTYTPNMVKEFGMVAGGTGITPMYQIIKAISNNPSDNTKVTLLYGSVTEEDILLKDELEELSSRNSNLKVIHFLNNPPENWNGETGFITKDKIEQYIAKPTDDVQLLLCGPPPMVSAIKKGANELGFKKAKPVSKLGDQIFVF
ncbi:hypothetical protein B5S28_g4076 [[Candida] boidinii]|uniref:Unnamed protein product n=1 Tax=Candida boidinii TaxID=5477 RepID=A0ACB5TEY6_CANBO|nr:hypothetical protein B5S28_g4076 [[Candida] boidinii]OWB63633.1 hypothetical protein B5S29_g4627 [[Candida] boidinii]OWB70772.1 hypothetical protein B5S31_g451 [[Candida] boidinii]OWB79714.1 hypothetical protein B5S32_g3949 [[Candida] boidinii]GME81765.1 unnamed protein product [[Candida] boidinii]